jgi:hypothetical protein
MQLLSCTTNSPGPLVPKPVDLCVIPAEPIPPPVDSIAACGDKVCMSVDDAKALAGYIHAVKERDSAIARCSLVVVK